MQLLTGTLYDPSSAVAKATSSLLAMTAFDTSNLRLTFTTPVNCTAVLVRIRCNLSGATTMPQVLLGVLDGATVKGRQVALSALPGTALATTNVPLVAEFLVTVTGNTAYTWDAAYGVETVVAATNIHYGGPNNTTANDAWGGFAFEIWDPAPAPTNFDVFSIDTNGRIDVIKVAGTTQTARDIGASVLLSSGTGTGQLDFTSGVVKANLAQILGTALTETAGQIAAAFKQFFNIASPTSTMNVITTVTNLTNAPTVGDLTTAMKTSVENAVLNADMTGHQTQGSLGQAIGDPVADTNTIYKAVVTDATGATVGVDVVAVKAETASIQTDTNDIQTRIPAALSGDGFMKSDLKSIEDDLTSGNNAVLKLKSLDLRSTTSINPLYIDASGAATAAVVVQASGADAEGVSVSGDAIGVDIGGNSHALGLYSTSGKSIDAPNDIAVSDGDLTLAAIADSIWDEDQSTHTSAGTFGKYVDLQLSTIAGYIDSEVGAIKAVTDRFLFDANDFLKVSLESILGSIFTEGTPGFIAAAFQKFFNVTTPTSTMNVITTVTNLTNAPTVGDFTAVMKTSLNAATPAVTVSDKTGFSLSTAGILAIWHQLTSAIVTAGTIGKLLVDNVNATISSRSSHSAADIWAVATRTLSSFGTLIADTVDAVWDEATSGHTTAGTTGKALTDAGAAGDPWGTALPGAYGTGTAGKIIGDNINATVSSRASQSSLDTLDDYVDTEVAAIKAKTDNLPDDPADESLVLAAIATRAAPSDAMILTSAYDAAKTAAQVDDIPTPADILTAAESNPIHANIKEVNDVDITGDGTVGSNPWRKA
jgi:hypothetical protein